MLSNPFITKMSAPYTNIVHNYSQYTGLATDKYLAKIDYETVQSQIFADLNRLPCIVSEDEQKYDIIKRWGNATTLWENQNEPARYIQGDLNGSPFASMIMQRLHFGTIQPNLTSDEQSARGLALSSNSKHIDFGYIDDNNKICGFSLWYDAQFPNTWVISISRDFDCPVDARTLTIFATPNLGRFGAELSVLPGDHIKTTDLRKELSTILCSKMITTLLNFIIDENGNIDKTIAENFQSTLTTLNIGKSLTKDTGPLNTVLQNYVINSTPLPADPTANSYNSIRIKILPALEKREIKNFAFLTNEKVQNRILAILVPPGRYKTTHKEPVIKKLLNISDDSLIISSPSTTDLLASLPRIKKLYLTDKDTKQTLQQLFLDVFLPKDLDNLIDLTDIPNPFYAQPGFLIRNKTNIFLAFLTILTCAGLGVGATSLGLFGMVLGGTLSIALTGPFGLLIGAALGATIGIAVFALVTITKVLLKKIAEHVKSSHYVSTAHTAPNNGKEHAKQPDLPLPEGKPQDKPKDSDQPSTETQTPDPPRGTSNLNFNKFTC